MFLSPGIAAMLILYAILLGLARTVCIHRIWPCIRWFLCQEYPIYRYTLYYMVPAKHNYYAVIANLRNCFWCPSFGPSSLSLLLAGSHAQPFFHSPAQPSSCFLCTSQLLSSSTICIIWQCFRTRGPGCLDLYQLHGHGQKRRRCTAWAAPCWSHSQRQQLQPGWQADGRTWDCTSTATAGDFQVLAVQYY